ncbi:MULTISPECIES: NAD(P)/FAD-dependent oxidoreductase [Paenarthrobacter]|uniref:NAD(P)/FAD-dependent oxidoreductase n=1 Tax=Paenarthrobacter TaxID=1742992 RepID=UPI001642AC1A|nr:MULTISPECIES: NAD(P)/FAD-dependent oxidoreductase [Paenarthrobacter]MDP9937598.1 hypothetical protein [Paenarthrobacter nicotinovorans]UXM91919.1 NAD(P)/FAD-dependent oxidoreductase [Paenarthrobacter sp. JL.01a]
MVTQNTSVGAARNNNVILGSGLSGMVAAYIAARALEDDASHDKNWSAERAFRPKLPRWRPRRTTPEGPGPALAS